jgi:hypothetical protein
MIEGLIARANSVPRLDPTARQKLIDDLVDALGFAMAGLRGVVRGKRARPDAWALDILYRDVSDALARAGIATTMHPDPALSRAQTLTKLIAEKVGLAGHGKRGVGNLFMQAQRSRKIEKRKLPDVLIQYTPGTGEVVTTIGDPAAPLARKRRQFDLAT